MPDYSYKLTNGKTLTLSGDTPPSDDIVEEYAKKQGVTLKLAGQDEKQEAPKTETQTTQTAAKSTEEPSPIQKVIRAATTPLVGPTSEMQSATSQFNREHPILGTIADYAKNAMLGSSSPLGIGLAGVGGAEYAAARAGLPKIAQALSYGTRGLGAGFGAKGAVDLFNPNSTLQDRITGGLDLAAGSLGVAHPSPEIPKEPLPTGTAEIMHRAWDTIRPKEEDSHYYPDQKPRYRIDRESGSYIPIDKDGKQIGSAISPKGEPIRPDLAAESKYNPAQGDAAGNTDFLTKAANLGSATTRLVLGFHVPKTAFSFHGVNEAVRNSLFGETYNPINTAGRFVDAFHYIFRPGAAEEFLNVNRDRLNKAINEGGLSVDVGDVQHPGFFKGDNILTKGINAFTDPKPLFQQVIPALKLKSYERLRNQYIEDGMNPIRASQTAGYATNNIFGGMNLQALQRSPQTQKLFRAALLAPDWLESNGRLGLGMAQAIKNPTSPEGKVYRVGMTNFLGAYIAANAMNAINNDGKLSFQNDVGHELDIALGKDSMGRTRYFSPFGTSMQMISIPLAVAHAASKGNMGEFFQLMRSRGSEPLQILTDLATNTDFAGRALYGKTKFGKQMSPGLQLGNIAGDVSSHLMPVGVESALGAAQGKMSLEEAAAKLAQLPLGYRYPERKKK